MDSQLPTYPSLKKSTDFQKDEDGNKEEMESSLCPFRLSWSFGINPEVPVINLTTQNRTIIAYACSHVVIIYNYMTKKTTPLQGHKNAIKTLSTNADGKWLLSADFEEDCAVVVWDTETGVPISTLFNPHGKKGITAAEISPNAKYIVTVGNETIQKVQLWLWTYGKDEADASMELSELVQDRVKEIAFNQYISEEFALTSDSHVTFCKWEHKEIKHYTPKILGNVRRYGMFNCSCYIPNTQRALTATTNGYVMIWDVGSDKGTTKSKSQVRVNKGEKRHVKSQFLQKHNITTITYHNRMIVLGTSERRISFYDINFKILYWWQSEYLDSIRSISFDLFSTLVSPSPTDRESEFEIDDYNDFECGEEEETYSRSQSENPVCEEKLAYMQKIESIKSYDDVSTNMIIHVEERFKNHDRNERTSIRPPHPPTNAENDNKLFYADNFIISCSNGIVALVDIPALKCEFIFQNASGTVTSLDAHPRSNYLVAGNAQGFVCLYNYEKHKLIVRKKIPPFLKFHELLNEQMQSGEIIYITSAQYNEKLTSVSVVKYSPIADLLVCGLDNGTLWMLHPITLELLDANPYKHCADSIIRVTFTECGEYMAYADNSFLVVLLKKNQDPSTGPHIWNLLGCYRSHLAPIVDIIFGPPTTASVAPRFFTLGEDRNLVEYDLKNSGPFPDPGLQILEISKIECAAVPHCLAWYPQLGIETFLIFCNSEYKYRLINDTTKTIRGTFLGPLYGEPVKRFKVLSRKDTKGNIYMVFATDKEIGLQILPLDGNPYKILGMIGHPYKVTNICVNRDENILFTSGLNDPCILMWKIKCKSVDVLAQLGGPGLLPYYCLIQGGANGWLANEMKDLFYYAQILEQGENTLAPRIISETVNTKEIPNLMRAIGFYPSNEEIEILMSEVAYRDYAETGRLVEDITFADFTKLYINHRPALGISMDQLIEAFRRFKNPRAIPFLENQEAVLSRDEFVRILVGHGPSGLSKKDGMPFGEPLTVQEARTYLRFLLTVEEDPEKDTVQREEKTSITTFPDFSFLPEMISYKDFTTVIMGIEMPDETRADDV